MNSVAQLKRIFDDSHTQSFRKKVVPALSAGLTSGLGLLVAQVAFASFIFSGPLAAYSSQGVGLILFGNFAGCLLVALLSGYRGAIAGLSPALVIIMATVVTSINSQGHELFVTASFALMISAVLTGICCFVVGRYRLTSLVRFIPFPVSCGFIAGIGGMVCLAALSLVGAQLNLGSIHENFKLLVLVKWLPGVLFGAALYILIKRFRTATILPVGFFLVIGAYHLVLSVLGISREEAQAADLLLLSTLEGNLWPVLQFSDLFVVNWAAIMEQIPGLLTLVLIAQICVILNIAGLELSVNRELDWDREFKSVGFASMAAGVGGGTVATLIVPSSYRSMLLGATTRLTGVIAALVIAVALLFGDRTLEFVPKTLISGILVFAGLGMLDEGFVRSYKRLPWTEFGVVLLIFFGIIFLGLIEGVAIGMLTTLVLFAIRLSRVGSLEVCSTAKQHASSKVRTAPERAILHSEGDRVCIFKLNGYIFFGSVVSLVDELKANLQRSTRPVCLLLDFGSVTGFDYSAVSALSRFLQRAYASSLVLVLSQISASMKTGLRDSLPRPVFESLKFEESFDSALERCEDTAIKEWNTDTSAATQARLTTVLEQSADELELYLNRQIQFETLMDQLEPWLSRAEYEAGETLIGPNADTVGLQFLVSGRSSAYDESGIRVSQFSPGDSLWTDAGDSRKLNIVLADEACQTKILSPENRTWLEQSDTDLALNLYRYLFREYFKSQPQGR